MAWRLRTDFGIPGASSVVCRDEAKHATWKTPSEIKEQYRSASILKNRRVVFNIKGNDYRLVVAIAYEYGAIYIKFIGTHQQYDEIDASTVSME